MGQRVRLRLIATHYVTCEADVDRQPPEQSLMLGADVFRGAIALAKMYGWAEPGRKLRWDRLGAPQVSALAQHLRQALAADAEEAGPASRRFGNEGQLREFFERPANRRALQQLADFLAVGGELVMED